MIVFLNNWAIAYFLGAILSFIIYLVTDELVNNVKYALWIKYTWANRAPFSCHKCFNFWTNVFVCSMFAIIGLWKWSIGLGFFGLLYTLAIWANVGVNEKEEDNGGRN